MSRPKVLITRRWPAPVEAILARDFDVTLNDTDTALSASDLHDALRQFDIVCPTITDRFDTSAIGTGALRAKALCNFGAGVNHIDLDACRAQRLIVTNTPDVLTDDTADLAILLALMCARRAGEGERLVRRGEWTGWTPTQLLGRQISRRTLGVIGFGRIGQATAARAHKGFDMQVVYTSRRPVPDHIAALYGARYLPLDDLLAVSDVVSLHMPGGGDARHLINAQRLAMMKPSAILINTARGDVVDEDALADALECGRIAAAGLDVHEAEPTVSPSLRALENVVLLPHLGSATAETRSAMGMRAVDNMRAILDGREPSDRVA